MSKLPRSQPFVVATLLIAVLLVLGALIMVFLNSDKPEANSTAIHYTYTVVNTYSHDTNAFTEGLVYSDGFLYESTGLYGRSSLRLINLTTGNVLQEVTLPSQYFGEGMTIVNNTIIQLTWQSHIGFVYDRTTFALLENFTYPTEGWGLTFDGKQLIMSDGSDNLYFLDPTTFQRTRQIQVHDINTSIVNINELEYINGDIYANIWKTHTIAVIDPETGQVKAWTDLTGIQNATTLNSEAVLNGIAYDPRNDKLYVTGKDWPNLYQIKLVPKPAC